VRYPANRRDSRILGSLKKCAASVEQIGAGRWNFELVNGKSFAGIAQTFDEWLVLDAAVTDRIARREMWDLLRMNSMVEGPGKFVLMPDNRSVRLRADIPLIDDEYGENDREGESDDNLALRLSEACAGLKEAFRNFRGQKNEHAIPQARSEDAEESSGQVLHRLCSDAGWSFTERSAGKLAVDLDARGGFYQALIEQRNGGAYVSVEVALCDALGATSRQAMSVLLLKTGALVRLARPSIEENETQIAARFEVRFATRPGAVELGHALSSLSVACSLCGREVWAIKDEGIARAYLAIAGIAADYAGVKEEATSAAAD
jgi:hypothetical protein